MHPVTEVHTDVGCAPSCVCVCVRYIFVFVITEIGNMLLVRGCLKPSHCPGFGFAQICANAKGGTGSHYDCKSSGVELERLPAAF